MILIPILVVFVLAMALIAAHFHNSKRYGAGAIFFLLISGWIIIWALYFINK